MATFTGSDKAIAFLFDMVANMAADYDSTSTYAIGDYAIYNGTLYKCAYTISTPEDFAPAHWQAVLVMDEITSGGGGGGTTVVANPAGAATDTLNKLQVASTIYSVSGGGSLPAYSTTEHVVGTWTDGTSLYERTFIFNSADMQGTWQIGDGFGTLFYLPYGDEISKIWFDVGNSFTYTATSGAVSSVISWPIEYGGSGYTRTSVQRSSGTNNNKMVINYQTTYPSASYNMRNNLTFVFTLRYTKTV